MNDWRHFRAKVERTRRGEYESLLPEQFPPLQVYLGGGKPRRLLYFTKDILCVRWMLRHQFPRHWVALVRYGLPTSSYLAEIRSYSKRLGLPVLFVGELDPIDLTIYLMLLRGDVNLAPRRAHAIPVRYVGVSDHWLAMRRSKDASIRGSLGMERLEREHLRLVMKAMPELKQLVGERCFSLLEAGHKLELEGASESSVAGSAFLLKLLQYLDRAGRSPKGRMSG